MSGVDAHSLNGTTWPVSIEAHGDRITIVVKRDERQGGCCVLEITAGSLCELVAMCLAHRPDAPGTLRERLLAAAEAAGLGMT